MVVVSRFLLLLHSIFVVNVDASDITELGTISISHPGFMTLATNSSEKNLTRSKDLLLSRFNGIPFSPDYVTLLPEIGAYMEDGGNVDEVNKIDVAGKLQWPNEVKAIPGMKLTFSHAIHNVA